MIVGAAVTGAEIAARRQATWNAHAFHNPADMPDIEDRGVPDGRENSQADVVYVRAWMKAISGGNNGS